MPIKKSLFELLPYSYVKAIRDKKRRIPAAYEPEIYNEYNEKMHLFYLQDDLCPFIPYSLGEGRISKYILWDRYNFGLKNHVYTHKNVLKTCGFPDKKYALFLESGAIMPKDYTIFDTRKELAKEFDIIFTHSQKLLNEFTNARWIPGGQVWYGGVPFGGEMSADLYLKKDKNISMVSSGKEMCSLHKKRIATVRRLDKAGVADGFGTYPGNHTGKVNIAQTLERYRYSIVFENNIEDYYFTEKILNCFAAMTIPVYVGARKIGDFFDENGIIQISEDKIDQIENIVRELDEKDYFNRKQAIVNNYERVQEYLCLEDYIYQHYFKEIK